MLFGLCVGLSGPLYAQKSKLRLEAERKENQRKISEAARILEQTAQQKTATLGELNALNQQLNIRSDMVANLNEEIGILVQEIKEVNEVNTALEADLAQMRREYGLMVYQANKHKASSKLMFLLSAESFYQFWRRLQYLKEFRLARTEQIRHIQTVQKRLARQKEVLLDKTKQRESLLSEQVAEKNKLSELQNKQEKVVQKLTAREQDLKQELEERKERDARLNRLIADMIRREMRRAARAAKLRAAEERKAAKAKTPAKIKDNTAKPVEDEEEEEEDVEPTTIALSAEGLSMSRNFSGNRHRLIWPVESGFISEHFGKHAHPIIPHVMVDNLGVDIQTKTNQAVRSVFDGEIGFVAMVPGANGKIVSVIHGDYITVYCNVRDVTVDVGQRVKAGQLLGMVAVDKDGTHTLQFQIWRNQTKLNPEEWLRRR